MLEPNVGVTVLWLLQNSEPRILAVELETRGGAAHNWKHMLSLECIFFLLNLLTHFLFDSFSFGLLHVLCVGLPGVILISTVVALRLFIGLGSIAARLGLLSLLFSVLLLLVLLQLLFVKQDWLRLVVQVDKWLVKDSVAEELELSPLFDLKDNVLWLEVSVDDSTDAMEVV